MKQPPRLYAVYVENGYRTRWKLARSEAGLKMILSCESDPRLWPSPTAPPKFTIFVYEPTLTTTK